MTAAARAPVVDDDGAIVVVVQAMPAMRELRDQIARIGRGTAAVLLRGESGTGKELAA